MRKPELLNIEKDNDRFIHNFLIVSFRFTIKLKHEINRHNRNDHINCDSLHNEEADKSDWLSYRINSVKHSVKESRYSGYSEEPSGHCRIWLGEQIKVSD